MKCCFLLFIKRALEFPGGSVGSGSGIVTAAAWVAAAAQVQSLVWKFPHAMGMATHTHTHTKEGQNEWAGERKCITTQ